MGTFSCLRGTYLRILGQAVRRYLLGTLLKPVERSHPDPQTLGTFSYPNGTFLHNPEQDFDNFRLGTLSPQLMSCYLEQQCAL